MTIDSETLPPLSSKEEELDEGNPLAKSKLILFAKFSELHRETSSYLHSVRVCLTANELLVLKRSSEKSGRFSLVRKHRLGDVDITLHDSLANAMSVEVPLTLLRYVYQLENGGNIKLWLSNVAKCREKLKASSSRGTSKSDECHASDEEKLKEFAVNDFRPASFSRSLSVDVTHKSFSTPCTPVLHRHSKSEDRNGPRKPIPKVLWPSQRQDLLTVLNGEERSLQDLYENSLLQSTDLRRIASDRAIRRREALRAKDYASYMKEKRENTSLGNSASTSDLESLQKSGIMVPPEDILGLEVQESTTRFPPPPSPSPTEFLENPFRHTQIRKGRMKFSPRINRSVSTNASPTPTVLIESYSQARLSLDATLQVSSVTLPRSKKSMDEDRRQSAPGHSSPIPIHKLGKSPKLLKLFHRRWQSSSGIKVQLALEGEDTSSTNMPGLDETPQVARKLHHLPPREVAEELTLMDAEMLRRIQSGELEDGAWMDKASKNELAPNVMAMVRSFNRLALLVPTEILEEKAPQARSKVIATFIQVASKCYHLRNYNSLKAILAGLQCTPIYRLKKTWKEVPSKRRKRFNQLTRLMSEEDNWQMYRQDLERSLTTNTPCVPFLGLFLTQVVQQESYHKMREENNTSTGKKGRRRSSSFGTYRVHGCSQDDKMKKLTWRASTLSISAPTSPVGSDYEDNKTENFGRQFEDDNEGFVISNPAAIRSEKDTLLHLQQSGLATSESSLDSKCSVDDYLKHRSVTTPQILQAKSPESFSISDTPKISLGEGTLNFDAVDLGHISPPEPRTSHKQTSFDDVDIVTDDTADSGLHSLSHRSSSLPKSSSRSSLDGSPSTSDLDLVNFTLKKSRSVESLLATYAEVNQLRGALHNTLSELSRLSASLQSLESVFSNDEESTVDLNLELSDCHYEASCPHHCPINTNEYETCPLSSSVQSCKFLHELRDVRQELYTERNFVEGSHNELHSISLTSDLESPTAEQKTHAYFKVKRSKSYGPATTNVILRRRKRTVADKLSGHRKLPTDPAGLLRTYQQVSLDCCPSVDSKSTLRTLLTDFTHNSEGQNYKLSYEREPA